MFLAGFVAGVLCTLAILGLFLWFIDRTAADDGSTR
jgi:hypothetical protein